MLNFLYEGEILVRLSERPGVVAVHEVVTAKPLGLVAVLVLICGLSFLVWRWPQGRDRTFSEHAAAYWQTILYYIGLFTVALPLLVAFFVSWFGPRFRLPLVFSGVLVASAVLQYVVALIPEVGGWMTRVHRFLTRCSALLLMPAVGFIVASPEVGVAGRWAASVGLVGMLAVLGVIVLTRAKNDFLLVLQAAYYAAFFVAVMVATYTS